MIYLLDNNVLSELWKPKPDLNVLAWCGVAEWYVPVVVIAEIQEGASAAPSERRKLEIETRLDRFLDRNPGAVMEWNAEAARTWGKLKHSPEVKRQPQALWDSLIDAMGVALGATVATRNGKDFRHAATFNPWDYQPSESEDPAA